MEKQNKVTKLERVEFILKIIKNRITFNVICFIFCLSIFSALLKTIEFHHLFLNIKSSNPTEINSTIDQASDSYTLFSFYKIAIMNLRTIICSAFLLFIFFIVISHNIDAERGEFGRIFKRLQVVRVLFYKKKLSIMFFFELMVLSALIIVPVLTLDWSAGFLIGVAGAGALFRSRKGNSVSTFFINFSAGIFLFIGMTVMSIYLSNYVFNIALNGNSVWAENYYSKELYGYWYNNFPQLIMFLIIGFLYFGFLHYFLFKETVLKKRTLIFYLISLGVIICITITCLVFDFGYFKSNTFQSRWEIISQQSNFSKEQSSLLIDNVRGLLSRHITQRDFVFLLFGGVIIPIIYGLLYLVGYFARQDLLIRKRRTSKRHNIGKKKINEAPRSKLRGILK
jgi:hypothetical protein